VVANRDCDPIFLQLGLWEIRYEAVNDKRNLGGGACDNGAARKNLNVSYFEMKMWQSYFNSSQYVIRNLLVERIM
jgi:hypothetical protein